MEAVRTPVPAAPAGARFGRLARSLPDARLVARVGAGDEAAFEALFERYQLPLLAFCRHMLGTREEAEDALQHVFVAAHRQLASGDGRVVELRPWLYTVARNRCLSVLRARREAVALGDVAEPAGAGLAVAEEVQQREDLQAVLADLARLPDDQRAALVLSELGALSHDEVADVLGVRRDKVKALVFQARESLAGWRTARDADCREIREQLATLSGGALRRGPLRKHLDTCEGCREFRSEVRRQREVMALLLPVVPSVALKAKVLGAVAAGGHLLPAAGGGVAGVAGAGLSAGAGATSAGGIAGKLLVVAALAGTAGGGYAVVHERAATHPAHPATRVVAPAPRAPLPTASPTAAPTPAAVPARERDAAKGARTSRSPASPAARSARGEHGRSTAAQAAQPAPGRPAVPGANGLQHAPQSQGLAHRRTDPPARGARETAPGASAGRGAGTGAQRRESRPARPVVSPQAHPSRPAAGPCPDVVVPSAATAGRCR